MGILVKCCVCDKEEQFEDNPLLECGNCTIAIHQGCYGVRKSSVSSNWFCRKCESQVRISKIRCDLCPIKEGAFKRSSGFRCGWVHILCALYFPETHFEDIETMDSISLENIPPDRFGRLCVFCERNQRSSQANHGACIQCSLTSCRTYFHVTCARIAGLLSELPTSLIASTKSLAVMLSLHSKTNEDVTNCHSVQSSSSLDLPLLHGFCCSKHKEKFFEAASTSSPVKNLNDADARSPEAQGTPSTVGLPDPTCSSESKPQTFPTASDNASSMSNAVKLSDDQVVVTANGSTELNDTVAAALTISEWSEPKPKYLKSEAVYQKDSNLLTAESSANALTSTSRASCGQPGESTCSGQDSCGVQPVNKVAPPDHTSVISPMKKVRNRREPKKSRHKSSIKSADGISPSGESRRNSTSEFGARQRDLSLSGPARPLPIRGIGLPLKNGRRSSTDPSEFGLTDSNATSPVATPVQSPLATMQDLLEWQWDQAGTLLMQQVEGTDVVSLLDCLHQLKSENDSLEAKLVRLKTRQEHLRSVNARLAASLATMESTVAALPAEDNVLNQPSNSLRATQNDSNGSVLSHPRTTNHTTRHSQASPDRSIPNSRSLISTANTACLTVSSPAFQAFDQHASGLLLTNLHGGHKSPEVPNLLPRPYAPVLPASAAPFAKTVNFTNRPRHIKRPDTVKKLTPKQESGSSNFAQKSAPVGGALSSNNLMELSARLSSAIAARQPNISTHGNHVKGPIVTKCIAPKPDLSCSRPITSEAQSTISTPAMPSGVSHHTGGLPSFHVLSSDPSIPMCTQSPNFALVGSNSTNTQAEVLNTPSPGPTASSKPNSLPSASTLLDHSRV